MAEARENLVLVHLRRLDEKLDRLADHVVDLKVRTTNLEQQSALVLAGVAALSARVDRVAARLERIERRLDLVGTA